MTTQPGHRSNDPAAGSQGLSVHLHPSCFSYVLKDRQIAQQFHCQIGDDQLRQFNLVALSDWLTDHKDIFLQHHTPLHVCVHAPSFHLLPDATLASEAAFELINHFDPLEHVLFTDILPAGLAVQFALPHNLAGLLTSHFESGDIRFGDRGFLMRLTRTDVPPEAGVYCQLMGQDITVGIVRDGAMVFFNKYPVKNREDLLYYLLMCYQSNGLHPHTDPLYVSGLIERDSPMFALIFDYIRNVSMDSGADHYRFDPDVERPHSPHYFVNLLNVY